jgi:chromosome segregation ATPase
MTQPTIEPMRALAAALAAAAALSAASTARAEPEQALEPAMQEQVEADRAAISAQERINELSDETRELLRQYRQYLSEAQTLRDYTGELETQVESQTGEIEFAKGQLVEIETTSQIVLPLMKKMLETLDRFVHLDVPFQLEERGRRIHSLEETMARADVTLSEKYRRIIEAYQIEIDYGRTLEAYQGELAEEAGGRTVRFLRIGRVALLYQTLDGDETGYWDAEQGKWVVDDSYRSAVQHGFAVADKMGAPDLLRAPVPAPTESRS